MPVNAAFALMLAAASPAGALHFDLSANAPDRQPYRAGGHGVEPGGSAADFAFSVAVPEGLYRVTVRLGDRRVAAEATVKAEARRLMLRGVATRAGQFVTRSFLVDVRTPALPPPPQSAPGGATVRIDARDRAEYTWDDKLTLEFLGDPRVTSVDIVPATAPTLYLVGDSTVTDQSAEPYASWGQMLPAMLDDTVAVANHARSGATLKSFLTDLRFDKVLSRIKPGDWLFIQFGHNDQKAEWPQTYVAADTTYPAYLAAYIAEARRRGAFPVLVTSPERRTFDARGRIKETLGGYPQAVRALAQAQAVPLIDLNADSRAIYEALGPTVAPRAFANDGADLTHHDDYGAWLLASAVAERIRAAIPALASHVVMPRFSPAHPPAPSEVAIVASAARAADRPAGS
ncbi:rhamnogalacturonan acetylesterase [Sphingomonas sp. H39-1-10]|uniref:rhamnogalacturonan acetylesterase n=1 Tax=Sphingomonas pollutisoli TaxID=3030829 RepID=UPI0023B896A5|nr:rhamnogalacturonan acetylesterase [Sphingomonas pollutisoli]MDF0487328.1 rhamnogalacturonan acetylesterase [Sphingomonas pollutisoli]